MANALMSQPTGVTASPEKPDDLGIDRAFLIGMARIPFIAVLWAAAAWLASLAVQKFGWYHVMIETDSTGAQKEVLFNLGPIAIICIGMLLAAWIDGYAFKVPNWVTLSLVMSGWYIGILHSFGVLELIPGAPVNPGGIGAALAGTAMGFFLLFPALFIRGMGQGDVKMTMGFGSWIFAYFGFSLGILVLLWSFAIGVIIGGIFGLVIMVLRRQLHKNLSNFREIATDLQVLVTAGPAKAAERAESRKQSWWRLPYGVPLCAGFLLYLTDYFFFGFLSSLIS